MKLAPITVKSYGLIEFTKKQYILTQLGVFLIGFPLITAGIYIMSRVAPDYLIWALIIGACIAFVGEIVETIVMLVLFFRKEHQASSSQGTPSR